MSVKSKKMRKVARSAAMSALIVSAIVNTGVIASAADNTSTISSGKVEATGANSAAAGLKVDGGTLYVATDAADNGGKGFLVGANNGHPVVNMGPYDTRTNAWVTNGGKVFIGQKKDGSAVAGAKMTVDNMTIDNGTVDVTNNSTLTAASGDIVINKGGMLRLSGSTGSTVAATGNVDINQGGTLEAASGTDNRVQAAIVNLKGGTIQVSSNNAASLTIGTALDGNLGSGNLIVASTGTLHSYGGVIRAKLISNGETKFLGGTTTVDNMTVSGGTTTIQGNAVVNAEGNVAITGGTLEMKGGTLAAKGGAGLLDITGGTLDANLGVNTVKAAVNVSSTGAVTVRNGAELTVTGKLHVDSAATHGVVITRGGTLHVADLAVGKAGGVTVGGVSDTGTLSTTVGSIMKYDATAKTWGHNNYVSASGTGTGVASGGITLGDGTNTNTGTLILSGFGGKTLKAADFASGAWAGVSGAVVNLNSYVGNNIIFKDGVLENANREVGSGDSAQAPVQLVLKDGAIGAGSVIVAPSVTTPGSDLVVAGTLKLLGEAAAAGESTITSLNKLTLNAATSAVSVNGGATLNAGTLDMTNGKLEVLNATANLGILKATGGTIFVDPAYVNIGSIQGKLGAQVLTGAGSVVNVGGAQGWMNKPMQDAGFSFGNAAQATLGIAPTGTIVLDATGVVAVDATLQKDSDAVTYPSGYKYEDPANAGIYKDASQATLGAFWAGGNSLTVLDVSGLNGKPVFDLSAAGNKTVNIVDGAKLHVTNLTVKGLQIFSGASDIFDGMGTAAANKYDPAADNAGWAGSNLIQPDRMLTAAMGTGTDAGKLVAKVNNAGAALGMSSEFEPLMQGVWANALNNTNSDNAGIRFVSRAASTDYGLSAHDAARTIEGAGQMAAVAGVQGVTISAANAATNAVATRTSFAQPLLDKTKAVAMHMNNDGQVSLDSGLNAGDSMKNGLGLWIMPLYQSNTVWGMKSGNFKSGYNSDLGGVALGADYTIDDAFRFGLALNIGGGYSKSSGDFNSTDNRFSFWGINLYGGWTMNNFGLTADLGYTGNYNKVEQDMPASLQMRDLKADVASSAWNAGLKAEYKFETSAMDIIPHVGVRYMGLTTDSYDVKGGGTVFKVDQDFQSIWTFPIGVTLSKNIEAGSGWVFKPQVDLSVIPAAGDVKTKSKSRIIGVPGSAEAKMQVMDYVTFDGGVGFEFGNDNLNFGLNYNIQASEHRTAHGVFGTVRYEF